MGSVLPLTPPKKIVCRSPDPQEAAVRRWGLSGGVRVRWAREGGGVLVVTLVSLWGQEGARTHSLPGEHTARGRLKQAKMSVKIS